MSVLHLDRQGAVARVVLNRPASRNALNVALLLALQEAFEELGRNGSVRAIVLTGAAGAFCAGADIKEWAAEAESTAPAHDWVGEAIRMMRAVRDCPKPVIARIDGAAAGAGLDLALSCEFRFASERSRFICSYTRIAYPPDAGGSWLLPRIIGLQAARRFIYTGETWSAPQAAAHGLVDEVHAEAGLDGAVDAFAEQLALGPTVAIAEAKALLASSFSNGFAEQLALEQAAGKRCGSTHDHVEALAAANEKRTPTFVGA